MNSTVHPNPNAAVPPTMTPSVTPTGTDPLQTLHKPQTNPTHNSDSNTFRATSPQAPLPPPNVDPDDFDLSGLPPGFPLSPYLKYPGRIQDEFGPHEDDDGESSPSKRARIEDQILEFHRPKSPLDRLPAATQKILYQLLCEHSLRSVQLCIQRPIPRGFGIKTNHNSLSRFKTRYRDRAAEREHMEAVAQADAIASDPGVNPEKMAAASERLLRLRLVKTLADPKSRTREVCDLFQMHIRLRALDLARARVNREKTEQQEPGSCAPPAQADV